MTRERLGPEVQPQQAQNEAIRLRRQAQNWYRIATLFLVLGITTTMGGLIMGSEGRKDKASEIVTTTGLSLLVGGAATTRIAVNLDTRAKSKENTQKAINKINSV